MELLHFAVGWFHWGWFRFRKKSAAAEFTTSSDVAKLSEIAELECSPVCGVCDVANSRKPVSTRMSRFGIPDATAIRYFGFFGHFMLLGVCLAVSAVLGGVCGPTNVDFLVSRGLPPVCPASFRRRSSANPVCFLAAEASVFVVLECDEACETSVHAGHQQLLQDPLEDRPAVGDSRDVFFAPLAFHPSTPASGSLCTRRSCSVAMSFLHNVLSSLCLGRLSRTWRALAVEASVFVVLECDEACETSVHAGHRQHLQASLEDRPVVGNSRDVFFAPLASHPSTPANMSLCTRLNPCYDVLMSILHTVLSSLYLGRLSRARRSNRVLD